MKDRVGFVWDEFSLTPRDIVRSASSWCEPVIVLAPTSASMTMRPSFERFVETRFANDPRNEDLVRLMTFSESCIRLTSLLAGRLGLPGNSMATAEMLTNKLAQRRALRDGRIDPTDFWPLETSADFAAAEAMLPADLIAKPQVGSGSDGVTIVRTSRDLEQVVEAGWSDSRPYVLESRIEGDPTIAGPRAGDYVSAEFISVAGDHHPVAVLGKGRLRSGFKETGNVFPSSLGHGDEAAVVELASRALEALGVRHGNSHVEVKLSARGPRVIEVNGRIAGGLLELMRACGHDPVSATVRSALELGPPSRFAAGRSGVVAWLTLYPTEAFVASNPFADLRQRMVDVAGVETVKPKNLYLRRDQGVPGGAGHSIEVIVKAPDHERMADVIESVLHVAGPEEERFLTADLREELPLT